MKRAIIILFALTFALVVWNHFSSDKPTPSATPETESITSPVLERITKGRTQRADQIKENPTDTDEDEDAVQPMLSREQVDAYLLKCKRSAESLLNAFQETGDTNLLAEAAEKFPENSLVQLTMLRQELSPSERARWLESFKISSPDNALPNYLSAEDKFKAGDTEQALAEITAANKKSVCSTLDSERMQSCEEMLLLSGFSPAEAKENSMSALGDSMEFLSNMKQLAKSLDELQKKYKASGDEASATQLASLGVQAAKQLTVGNPTVISDMVANAMERIVLKNLDPNTHYDFLGATAGERAQALQSRKQEQRELMKNQISYVSLSDSEKLIYWSRFKLYGELNAMKWMKSNGETK